MFTIPTAKIIQECRKLSHHQAVAIQSGMVVAGCIAGTIFWIWNVREFHRRDIEPEGPHVGIGDLASVHRIAPIDPKHKKC